ncbi:MAG: peptidyl-prolyl cis-trans isomerase [Polyangiales bacterium]
MREDPRRRLSSCARGARLLCCVALVLGCDSHDEAGGRGQKARGSAVVGGQVVSTVDGHPITVAEVEELVHAGLPPREALVRLQAERVLMTEAGRRGFGADPAVEQVARQALVQTLIAAEADAVRITAQDIKEAYDKNKARFERKERRASVHVLASLPKKPSAEADAAAKTFARQMISELASAVDPVAFVRAIGKRKEAQFDVIAEKLPPTAPDGSLVQPFLTALFSVPQPGVVPEPVRTSFGWHAIRVIEIVPAEITPYEQASSVLQGELSLARKQERITALVDRLRKEHGVDISASATETLAKLEL